MFWPTVVESASQGIALPDIHCAMVLKHGTVVYVYVYAQVWISYSYLTNRSLYRTVYNIGSPYNDVWLDASLVI